jgi:hypothetical protein
MTPEPGWLRRELTAIKEDAKNWPDWMKQREEQGPMTDNDIKKQADGIREAINRCRGALAKAGNSDTRIIMDATMIHSFCNAVESITDELLVTAISANERANVAEKELRGKALDEMVALNEQMGLYDETKTGAFRSGTPKPTKGHEAALLQADIAEFQQALSEAQRSAKEGLRISNDADEKLATLRAESAAEIEALKERVDELVLERIDLKTQLTYAGDRIAELELALEAETKTG